jgi:hypothetical protein
LPGASRRGWTRRSPSRRSRPPAPPRSRPGTATLLVAGLVARRGPLWPRRRPGRRARPGPGSRPSCRAPARNRPRPGHPGPAVRKRRPRRRRGRACRPCRSRRSPVRRPSRPAPSWLRPPPRRVRSVAVPGPVRLPVATPTPQALDGHGALIAAVCEISPGLYEAPVHAENAAGSPSQAWQATARVGWLSRLRRSGRLRCESSNPAIRVAWC